jgi:hypothetical protein
MVLVKFLDGVGDDPKTGCFFILYRNRLDAGRGYQDWGANFVRLVFKDFPDRA